MKKWFLAILLICSISFITACGNDDNAPDEDDQIKQNDVVEQDPVNDDDFDDNDDDRDEMMMTEMTKMIKMIWMMTMMIEKIN